MKTDIEREEGNFSFFYEIEEQYKEYVVTERVDAFVLAILEYALWRRNR